MNKQEAKVLHGLYFDGECIGQERIYSGAELQWLATHTFRAGRRWRSEDKVLSAHEEEAEANRRQLRAVTADQWRPVAYLEARKLIEVTQKAGYLFVKVTADGVDAARRYATRWGRLNVWYRDQKDTMLTLLLSIIVAVVTSLVTNAIVHKRGDGSSGGGGWGGSQVMR